MKILFVNLAIACALLTSMADVTQGGFGAAKNSEEEKSSSRSAPESKRATYPFYGTLDSVDAAEKVITLRGKKKNRTIRLTAETRIQKNGAEAKLTDAAAGERVSGSVRKNADGLEEAVSVRFGEKKASK